MTPENAVPDLVLDLNSLQLIRAGQPVKLEKTPMELLTLLVRRRGGLVTREEIVRTVWGDGVHIEVDAGINTAIRKIRLALDDDPASPRYLETVVGKGYRFIGAITVVDPPVGDPRLQNGAVPAASAAGEEFPPVARPGSTPEDWKRRRLAVAAGVAALLVFGALAAWRVVFARPPLTEGDVILQTNFVNKTGDPIFDNSLDKALEIKLSESPFLSLFPEAEAHRTLGTMRHDPNERVTEELGIEICKRQGLKALVVPEIAAFGSRYLITLDAIDAQSQKSIGRRQVEAESKDKVIAALGEAAAGLRKQLGESLSSLEKYNAPLDLATTSSLEALQAYRTGLAEFRTGKTRESIPYFERAVELDPQFCSAYAMLGHSYFSIGDGETAKKNFAKAFKLKDGRVTQEENFQITAYYHSYITGNLEKETAVLVLYQQAFPRSVSAANRLGIAYMMSGRKEEALQQFNWAIAHSPVPSAHYYSNAAQALLVMDRFDQAKKLLDQWAQKGSLAPFQREMRYRIAFFENDTAMMEKLAREIPADDIRWQELQLQMAFLRGDLSKLRSLSQTMLDQDKRAKQMENAAADLALHAQLEAFLGNHALALKLCRQATEMNQDSAGELWHCAEAFAYGGDVADAQVLTTKLDRMCPEDTIQQKVFLQVMRSYVESARGDAAKAVDLLTPTLSYRSTLDINYQLAQAYLAEREPAKAAAQSEELLGHRGSGWWHIYAPLAQLDLARAYAMQGDVEKSRKAYDDFFTTWKAADPQIPLLVQAKAEYKKLGATASRASLSPPLSLN